MYTFPLSRCTCLSILEGSDLCLVLIMCVCLLPLSSCPQRDCVMGPRGSSHNTWYLRFLRHSGFLEYFPFPCLCQVSDHLSIHFVLISCELELYLFSDFIQDSLCLFLIFFVVLGLLLRETDREKFYFILYQEICQPSASFCVFQVGEYRELIRNSLNNLIKYLLKYLWGNKKCFQEMV